MTALVGAIKHDRFGMTSRKIRTAALGMIEFSAVSP